MPVARPKVDPLKTLLDGVLREDSRNDEPVSQDINDPELYRGNVLPVDIVQFVEDPKYLGGYIQADPQVLELLWLIEQPSVRCAYVEVGKGSGKSFVGAICPVYGIYRILCMKDPHRYFKVTPSTLICGVNVSLSEHQAKNVIFSQVSQMVQQSPWFQSNVAVDPKTTEVAFPGRSVSLYCGSSNDRAFLGFAVIRGVLDEANFMTNSANRNVADSLHSALQGSGLTRFPYDYKILAISSASTPSAWLHAEVNSIFEHGRSLVVPPEGLISGREYASLSSVSMEEEARQVSRLLREAS